MKSESCPNPEELRSFVRCNVSEQQADSIAEHLEQCPACEETVVGLERDPDTIAERIKQAAAQPTFAHEPECQQLLQSLLNGTTSSLPEPSNVEPPFQIDQILRDYQIVTKLGEGGMGAVYKAVHQRLKKTVALKVLPTNRIGDRPAVARFEREMEVLGQLNHPHIVQALDAGEHEGQHYQVESGDVERGVGVGCAIFRNWRTTRLPASQRLVRQFRKIAHPTPERLN